MVKNFIVLTRGRTGSSVVCDTLGGQNQVFCGQELFRPMTRDELKISKEIIANDEPIQENYQLISKQVGKLIEGTQHFHDDLELPFTAFYHVDRNFSYQNYFDYLNMCHNKEAVGFKVLSHHLDESWSGITAALEELGEFGVKVLYLQRHDILREAFSICIAHERKIYNLKKADKTIDLNKKLSIDVEQLLSEIKYIEYSREQALKAFKKAGVAFKEVFFEDYLDNKREFIKNILRFLGLKNTSYLDYEENFVKVTPDDLSDLVINYESLMHNQAVRAYVL